MATRLSIHGGYVRLLRRGAGAASVAVMVLLAACGGSGSPPQAPPPAGDTTPPTVQATSPAGSASAVATSTTVTVTFSEAVDATTLTASTFTLSVGGVAVAGSVSASGPVASFLPAAPLANGMVHSASVSTAVKDTAGNALAAMHTWTFTTAAAAAPSWSAPVLLETAAGQASEPAIAATSEDLPTLSAQSTAVWVQHDGVQPSIYVNRYIGGAWQGAELVESQTAVANASAGGAGQPRVAMGAFGRAVVTWLYDDGNAGYSIWGNVYDGAFAPANARQISAGGNASDPQIAFDGAGNDVFTVWTQYDSVRLPASYHITQRQFLFVPCAFVVPCVFDPNDFGWRSATLVETDPYDAIAPQISGFRTGGAVAVWSKAQGLFGLEVWGATHSKAGGWATSVRINGGNNRAEQPAVAAAPDGSAVATWIESVAGRKSLFASRLSGAGWSAPVTFDDASAGQVDAPQLIADAAGNSVIVWLQFSAGTWALYSRRCPPGPLSGCSAPAKIENLPGQAELPRIAGAPDGTAVVVWQQQATSGGPRDIYANHYSSAGGWGAAAELIDTAAGGAQVAIDKRGIATVVWCKFDASGKSSIYASRDR